MELPNFITRAAKSTKGLKYTSTIEEIGSGKNIRFHLASGTTWHRVHYSKLRKDIKQAFPGASAHTLGSYTHLYPPQVEKRVRDILSDIENNSGHKHIIIGHSFGGMIGGEAINRIREGVGDIDISLFTLGTPHNTSEIPVTSENWVGSMIKPSIIEQIQHFKHKDEIPRELKRTFSVTGDKIVPPELSKVLGVPHTETSIPVTHSLGPHFGYFTTESIRHQVVKEIGKHIIET